MFGSSVRKRSPDKGLFSKEGERERALQQYIPYYVHSIVYIFYYFQKMSVVVLGDQLSVSDLNCGRAGGNRLPWGRRLGLSQGKLSLGSL